MLVETQTPSPAIGPVSVRQLRESDLEIADRILRDAFDRFTGVTNLFGSRDFVRSRWRTRSRTAIAVEAAEQIVGSNFVTDWGSFGFFGPLSVHPELWDRGLGKALMEATVDLLSAAGIRQAGLFTFPQSAKHLGLYQRFDFWPQHLTCILGKSLSGEIRGRLPSLYSTLASRERDGALRVCRGLTASLFEELDLSGEIRAVSECGLGDTLLLFDHSRLSAFAVCQFGQGSEAGADLLYVKFAAVDPGVGQGDSVFTRLIDACEAFAAQKGMHNIEIGVNTACSEAYHQLLARRYRSQLQGVAMTRPNAPAYHRPGVYVLDDWR
jgi:GNAT superfamily N-acetyltransferase